jgi:hypothetical protein
VRTESRFVLGSSSNGVDLSSSCFSPPLLVVVLVLVFSAAVLVLEIVFPSMPRVRAAAGRWPGGLPLQRRPGKHQPGFSSTNTSTSTNGGRSTFLRPSGPLGKEGIRRFPIRFQTEGHKGHKERRAVQLPGKKPAVKGFLELRHTRRAVGLVLVLVFSAAVLVLEMVFPSIPRVRAAAGRSPGGLPLQRRPGKHQPGFSSTSTNTSTSTNGGRSTFLRPSGPLGEEGIRRFPIRFQTFLCVLRVLLFPNRFPPGRSRTTKDAKRSRRRSAVSGPRRAR